MKIKKFLESNSPQVGDYVICQYDKYDVSRKFNEQLGNYIGKIISIGKNPFPYHIRFNKELMDLILKRESNFLGFKRDEIVEFDKSKEELELKMNARKYNL